MRALVFEQFGLACLRFRELPPPNTESALGPHQVLLSLHAAALNHRDLLVVEGKYDPRFPLPLVPCSDGVGTVLAIGAEVDPSWLGTRVLPAMAPDWQSGSPTRDVIRRTLGGPLQGTAAELIVVPEACLVRAPAHLNHEEAATLPCAAVTAYRALLELSEPPLSDAPAHSAAAPWATRWVLCEGTGGVALFALQIAKALGASVVLTSSDDSKLEFAKRLGADLTLNYRSEPEWGRKIRELTGGVHHVIDVGGPGTLAQAMKACLPGATITLLGALAGQTSEVDLLPAVMNQLRLQGVYVGSRETLRATMQFFERYALRPHIHHTFRLDEGALAFETLRQKGHVGKICLLI